MAGLDAWETFGVRKLLVLRYSSNSAQFLAISSEVSSPRKKRSNVNAAEATAGCIGAGIAIRNHAPRDEVIRGSGVRVQSTTFNRWTLKCIEAGDSQGRSVLCNRELPAKRLSDFGSMHVVVAVVERLLPPICCVSSRRRCVCPRQQEVRVAVRKMKKSSIDREEEGADKGTKRWTLVKRDSAFTSAAFYDSR
ncbi:uncharacterized protein LY89DRAFT_676519 [Mollisia scopiformis]|uniref:Uncharacterized protein n=1 Tax=Mollisia scopiformis TaxID=149040 RepID=A0A132B9T0_MOLSC|nr:uncharacterized protein LY89DRAFT_676519 [Mollisia scopiformis]KUJ09158.1 hypothetical protein LY89DRAFT_676519 [Mollisia scopiformis]